MATSKGRIAAPAAAVALLTLPAGCAFSVLAPAPGAEVAGGRGRGAAVEVDGVRVVARLGAWAGDPPRLTAVLPVLVTLDNGRDSPIEVRYEDFTLVPERGEPLAAIPPFDIEAAETLPVHGPPPSALGFRVAPYCAPYYPYLRPYDGDFPFHRPYYDDTFPYFRSLPLPTGDMVQKGLPEGVLDPGGRITGFLYFEPLPRKTGAVVFRAEIRPARGKAPARTAEISFVAQPTR